MKQNTMASPLSKSRYPDALYLDLLNSELYQSLLANPGRLQDLMLGYLIPAFTRRAKRKIITHPKFYFFDTGIFQTLRPKGPLVNTASNSASLDSLAVADLYVTNQAAVNSLSVSSFLSIGTDLVIQTSSINTLTAPLALQSLAMAPVEIMAGKIRIETNGDVKINANLYVAGKIESESIKTKEITVEKLIIATTSEESKATSEVSEPGVSNGKITSNATAGTAVIPAGLTELEIENSKIENSSLIYVTPTSSTENNVLFVKSKQAGKFVVGFNQALDVDVTFNWWVVQVQLSP